MLTFVGENQIALFIPINVHLMLDYRLSIGGRKIVVSGEKNT